MGIEQIVRELEEKYEAAALRQAARHEQELSALRAIVAALSQPHPAPAPSEPNEVTEGISTAGRGEVG